MDKLHTNDENANYSKKQKIDNFFYHYKWHVIAAAFILFVILWVSISMIGQQGEEAYIGYIGEYAYSHSEKEEISKKMSAALDVDFDGDGKCTLEFQTFHFYSDTQLADLATKEYDPDEDMQFHPELNAKNYEHFITELESGNIAVWFVSKEVYDMMDKSVLMPIEDILGYVPERGAVDEYAYDCAYLPFSSSMTRELTYSTYLVMRVKRSYSFIMGEDIAATELEESKALYKAVVEYKK